MIRKKLKFLYVGISVLMLTFTGCVKDLDTLPLDKDEVTSASVYENPENYKLVLAKLYSGLTMSGIQGPAGKSDISGLDEGFGQYLRGYFYMQELTTDECIIGWPGDNDLRDLHDMDWTSSNGFVKTFYARVFYQVGACNEFIRETTPEKLDERGITGAQRTDIETFRAEARFLRALSYWHAIDLFGNVPFFTEKDKVGSFFPKQISRADLFAYLETELKEIETLLKDPGFEYARADKAAAWMLLSKLYLNAKVYIGQDKNTEAITWLKKVIDSNKYSLETKYQNVFRGDNHKSKEIIFPLAFDGVKARTYGGTTFIIKAAIGGKMDPLAYGTTGGWAGTRTTKQFVGKFWNLANLKNASIPLKKAAAYPVIYCPGGYQKASGYSAGDWDPASAPQLASVKSDNKYEGYIYFSAAGDFKFTAGPNWDLNWGDDGANGSLEPNGANLKVTAGYYKVNVDLNTKTYSIVKTDWGLIGDATPGGWTTDTNMSYDPLTKLWKVIVEMGAGKFKFRANDGWDINLGDDGANGTVESGGADIPVAAGKYEIKLKLGTPDYTYTIEKYSTDGRAMFYTEGQTLEINDIYEFTHGYAVTKWSNLSAAGAMGSDPYYMDTDFPVFRLADAYLMYAEAVLRGGSGGSAVTALQYVNAIRTRAYGDANGNIASGDLNLDFLIDERGRELYWECFRRTDLVRFGKFAGSSYIWSWKGGVRDGAATDTKYNLFPLSSADIAANPNLKQNAGY